MSLENNIKTFASIDDEMKRMSVEMKQLRTNKTTLEENISNEMTQQEIDEVSCQDDTKVKMYTKKKTSNPFKKPNVESCAVKLFGEDKAKLLVKMIEDMQETEESTGLKRLNSKKRKQND